MSTLTVTKKLTFDAAHRLYQYEGKCSNVHGHGYSVFVTLSTPALDSRKISLDFGVIKRFFQTWLDDKWDHKIILNSTDPLADHLESIVKSKTISGLELPYCIPYNPTAEGMAIYLATRIFPEILKTNGLNAEIVAVEVWETPTSYCTYLVEKDV